MCIVALAGVLTGVINGVIGGGSLVSYLALTATGLPPTVSASTNTVGVMMGNPAALITPFRKRQILFKVWFPLALVTAIGSVIGGLFLVFLPERIFEFLIPLLLIVAGTSVWVQPKRTDTQQKMFFPLLFSSGIYNGYFGPGQGILNLSILYRSTTYEPRTLVVLKNYIITLSNVSVAFVFILANKVIWSFVALLWVSVGLGGWLSHYLADHLNEKILRIALTALALLSAAYFIVT